MNTPTPNEIKTQRKALSLTQSQAADSIGVTLRSWQYWESGKESAGRAHVMPVEKWFYFLSINSNDD